jgi:Fur family transcriptional regulator, peroxide stress response regulator
VLKKDFPDLSLGTIYRNLSILTEQGKIKKIDFGSTYDRYDAHTDPHYHFICEKCGAIADLELPVDQELNKRADQGTPFHIRRHRIEFFGICDQCEKESE